MQLTSRFFGFPVRIRTRKTERFKGADAQVRGIDYWRARGGPIADPPAYGDFMCDRISRGSKSSFGEKEINQRTVSDPASMLEARARAELRLAATEPEQALESLAAQTNGILPCFANPLSSKGGGSMSPLETCNELALSTAIRLIIWWTLVHPALWGEEPAGSQ
jgi:hypothetical protein